MAKFNQDQYDQEPEQKTKSQTCAAFGCPLIGTLSLATNGAEKHYCRYHFGVDSNDWGGITLRIKQRAQAFENLRAAKLKNPYDPRIVEFQRKIDAYIRSGIKPKEKQPAGALKALLAQAAGRMSVNKTEEVQA